MVEILGVGKLLVAAVLLHICSQGVNAIQCAKCTYSEYDGKTSGNVTCKTSGTNVGECFTSYFSSPDYSSTNATEMDLVTRGYSVRDMKQGCVKLVANGEKDGKSFSKTIRYCKKSTAETRVACDDKVRSEWAAEVKQNDYGGKSGWAREVLQMIELASPKTNAKTKISACYCNTDKCNADGGGGSAPRPLLLHSLLSLPVVLTNMMIMGFKIYF